MHFVPHDDWLCVNKSLFSVDITFTVTSGHFSIGWATWLTNKQTTFEEARGLLGFISGYIAWASNKLFSSSTMDVRELRNKNQVKIEEQKEKIKIKVEYPNKYILTFLSLHFSFYIIVGANNNSCRWWISDITYGMTLYYVTWYHEFYYQLGCKGQNTFCFIAVMMFLGKNNLKEPIYLQACFKFRVFLLGWLSSQEKEILVIIVI